MNLRTILIKKSSIVTFLFLSLILFFYIGILQGKPAVSDINAFIETSFQCDTKSDVNLNELVVYSSGKVLAEEVAKTLCSDDTISKQYGKVTSYWGYKTSDTIEFLGKGIADLILAKENLINAFMAESTYNYQAVVGFPDYTAYLISSKEKPRIEKSYFLDKRIGLLDYPTSRSGHILPKQLFKKLDINLENLNINYASSHTELRELLASGKVDLISSYWQDSDQQRFSKNYITPIRDNISGSRWYLKMQDENTDLLCAVQARLTQLAHNQNSHYFNHVESFWSCDSQQTAKLGDSNATN
ncbi:hypothetical protein [uncultured Pseudoalteromonas sp.]|uniref:hypothetical protein n=1 Tax=uncultured Pseudoalteromonas sp. TaxID=114053 RepID=UPI001C765AB0|nr:hypothetical protein KQ246_18740 [Pseudoalteromonas shioyasakiensis]